ncbi:MAG: hypothetical protein ACT4NL_03265 [Pseudomarimonas sp.]
MSLLHKSLALGLNAMALNAGAATITVSSLADVGGSCPGASCTLRAAVTSASAGDQIVFASGLSLPGSITLSGGQLVVDRNLSIVGPGANRLTVAAGSLARVINHTAGVVTISGLRMVGGRQAATSGTSGPAGTGQAGMNGNSALGGCVRVGGGAQLTLMSVALDDCRVIAGDAGNGGSGTAGTFGMDGGRGGAGGSGGSAEGGAVWVMGSLALLNSSITGSVVTSGDGGNGGLGGEPGQGASRGHGGDGGNGGAARGSSVFVAAGGALIVRNSTLASGSIGSGEGGDGGNGGNSTSGGDGGAGGVAEGGAIHLAASATSLADLEFSTFAAHALAAGNGGLAGNGGSVGQAGMTGVTRGALFSNVGTAAVRVRSSAGFGTCFGAISAVFANLRSDASCTGFTVAGSAGDFRPITTAAGLAFLMPARPSLAVDAATNCNDLTGAPVTSDQLGASRPIDGDGNGSLNCDLGAIEYSIRVFGNGFE